MREKKKVPLNPGSDEAVAKGCICARMDNAYGKGYMGVAGVFCVQMDCPLHGRGFNKADRY